MLIFTSGSGSNLSAADFTGADLTDAILNGAADLTNNADLTGATRAAVARLAQREEVRWQVAHAER